MMRRYLSFIILTTLLLGISNTLNAQDLLPSDSYYKDNIAINEVHAEAPKLRSPLDGEDEGPGGGEWGGGGFVGAPVGDAVVPIMIAGLIYASFLLFRRRRNAI